MNIFRWAGSWMLYWAGDVVSRIVDLLPNNEDERSLSFRIGYPLAVAYQKLMGASVRLQGSGRGPWLTIHELEQQLNLNDSMRLGAEE